MSLQTAIVYLQGKVALFTEMKTAPSYTPENILTYPFSICFPGDGSTEFRSAGFAHDLDIIRVQFHFSRANLPKAIEQAIPYKDLMIQLLISDPTLGGNIATTNGLTHRFGYLDFADIKNIGWDFSIDVKLLVTS